MKRMRSSVDQGRQVAASGGGRRCFSALGLLLALGLAGGLVLLGCGDGTGEGTAADSLAQDSSATAEQPAEKKEKTSSVTVAEVIRDDLVLPVIAEGSIRARQSAGIRSELSGRITTLHCREGQRVRKDQPLLGLDQRDHEVALAEAQSAYLRALSQMAVEEGLDGDWNHLGDLGELGGLPQDHDSLVEALKQGEYTFAIKAGRTGLSSARASAERARLNMERCQIRAPFGGVITGLLLAPGEWISAGQELFALVDDVHLEAQVDILESDLGQIAQGRPALVAIPALAETLQVKLDIISPRLDVSTRSCQGLLRIQDESGRIRPGMFVRTAIAGQVLNDRLLVPREAILMRDGRPLVFKVEDDISQWLYVELGERNERFVEIKKVLQGGSLDPGDQVVVSDHLTLTHGAKVEIKKTLTPSVPWKLAKGDAP